MSWQQHMQAALQSQVHGQNERLSPAPVWQRARDDARASGFVCRANGSDAKLHGQGPRAEVRAARGALHVRRANARRVTPSDFDSNEPARPAGRSRAVPASAPS